MSGTFIKTALEGNTAILVSDLHKDIVLADPTRNGDGSLRAGILNVALQTE